MLIIRAFIDDGKSEKQIDEIKIQNMGLCRGSKNRYKYKIQIPKKRTQYIEHYHENGWIVLIVRAMMELSRIGYYLKDGSKK